MSILRMGKEEDWKEGITEVYRLDRRAISELPLKAFEELNTWAYFVNLNYTKHAKVKDDLNFLT